MSTHWTYVVVIIEQLVVRHEDVFSGIVVLC